MIAGLPGQVWTHAWRILLWCFVLLGGLTLISGAVGVFDYLRQYSDSVTLPNGMILRREFNFDEYGRDQLFTADGETELSRSVDFVCFNDRYVEVVSWQAQGGIFDGLTQQPVPARVYRAVHSQLYDGTECRGYYKAYLTPEFLYGTTVWPFLPDCSHPYVDKALRGGPFPLGRLCGYASE